MSHDLRQALGYRHLPASDAREQELRDQLFSARAAYVQAGSIEKSPEYRTVQQADKRLSDYLWERSCQIVAADRAKHPKAKRNAAVGSEKSREQTPEIEGLTRPDARGR